MEQNTEQNSSVAVKTSLGKPNFFKSKLDKIKSMTRKEWAEFVLNNLIYIIFIPFIIIVALINFGDFFSKVNIMNNVRDISLYMFAALGVGSVLVLSGADLSSGRIIGINAVLAAALLQASGYSEKVFPGMSPWPAILVALVVIIIGGLLGAFNGLFVAKFKLNPFIVTLVTQIILYAVIRVFFDLASSVGGVTSIMGSKSTIGGASTDYTNWVEGNISLGDGAFLYLFTFYAIAAILITWFMWNKTRFGKNMYAVGSNPEAANVSGVNVTRTIITVFIFAGMLYGFSGWVHGAIYPGPSMELGNEVGSNFILNALGACIIGGISLTGGVGKVRNVVLGVIMLQLISYSLILLRIQKDYQDIVKGALILFAVAVDMRRYLTKK